MGLEGDDVVLCRVRLVEQAAFRRGKSDRRWPVVIAWLSRCASLLRLNNDGPGVIVIDVRLFLEEHTGRPIYQ